MKVISKNIFFKLSNRNKLKKEKKERAMSLTHNYQLLQVFWISMLLFCIHDQYAQLLSKVLETQAVQIIDQPKPNKRIGKLEAMNMCAQIQACTPIHTL